jgi:hypothetical protein
MDSQMNHVVLYCWIVKQMEDGASGAFSLTRRIGFFIRAELVKAARHRKNPR